MKEITMFYLESCPYCDFAFQYMKELGEENPEYAKIPVKIINEAEQMELAKTYDYYYVPCYYIGDEKILEGVVNKAGVKRLFDMALG